MEDAEKRFEQLVSTLASDRPEELHVPIQDTEGISRGWYLDRATGMLALRGYQLYKVRDDGDSWIASYRLGRKAGAN